MDDLGGCEMTLTHDCFVSSNDYFMMSPFGNQVTLHMFSVDGATIF